MLHVISARCVACDLHMIAPGPLERTCWRRFTAQWGDCKKSPIAPLNVIIIIVIVAHVGLCWGTPWHNGATLYGAIIWHSVVAFFNTLWWHTLMFVCSLLCNAPATSEHISGMDVLRQFHQQPSWGRYKVQLITLLSRMYGTCMCEHV